MDYVYSDDPAEEARMLAVRDAPDRVVAMARCRVGHGHRPLAKTELFWLGERFVSRRARDADWIPFMEPREWHALTRALLVHIEGLPTRSQEESTLVSASSGHGAVSGRGALEPAWARYREAEYALVEAGRQLVRDAEQVLEEVCPTPTWTILATGYRKRHNAQAIVTVRFRKDTGDFYAQAYGTTSYTPTATAIDTDPQLALRAAVGRLADDGHHALSVSALTLLQSPS